MARRTDESVTSTSPFVDSSRVEGTHVYGPRGEKIGSIKSLMIEKVSGKVAYAVIGFGGFSGPGDETYTIPWQKLDYEPDLGGYRTDITE